MKEKKLGFISSKYEIKINLYIFFYRFYKGKYLSIFSFSLLMFVSPREKFMIEIENIFNKIH